MADPSVDELVAMTGWTGSGHTDWQPVEKSLGLRLPDDIKDLTARFPNGYFSSFLAVYSSAFLGQMEESLEILREWPDLPHPVHPAPGGLVPWSRTVQGHTFCWLTEGDPAQWPVVFFSADFQQWGEHPGGAAAFLLDLLAGRVTHDIFARYSGRLVPQFKKI